MNRRDFLAVAGGLASLPAAARADTCPALPASLPGWKRDWPTADKYPTTQPPNPYIPPETAGATAFQPAGKSIPRRGWSTLNPQKDRRLIQDVKDAYGQMRALPQSDPRSLIRQAWLHDYYCSHLPGVVDVHKTWAFLPWHRAFLYFHEQILGSLINKRDFRLPYWDWDRQGQIPCLFSDLGLPDFLAESAGRLPSPPMDWANPCVAQAWLLSESFTAFMGTAKAAGAAMNGPHGMAHALVGGAMRNPATAAADPMFYAHHGNVDRFWAYWQKQYQFKPPDEDWGRQEFYFHDAMSRPVRVTASDMMDIGQMGYSYDWPKVPLCPHESLDIHISDLVDPAKLTHNLKLLTLAGLITTGNLLARQFGKYFDGVVKNADLLNADCFAAFPVQMEISVPAAEITAGSYYVVGALREKFYRIGGAGVFVTPDHLKMETTVPLVVTGCLDPELYTAFQKDPRGFQLMYGKSDDGSDPDKRSLLPMKNEDWVVRLIYPHGYLAAARDLVDRFQQP